jgi:hypothetical protein
MHAKARSENNVIRVTPQAWSEGGKPMIICTLPETATESAVLASSILANEPTMDDPRAAHRRVVADVERVLDRYVSVDTTSAMRSPIALWAINETRIDRKTAVRKELHARPEPPQMFNRDGSPMRRVAPLRDVVQIVRVKSSAGRSSGGLNDTQLDRLDVGAILNRLQAQHSEALLVGSTLRREIAQRKAYIQFATMTLGSPTRRKRYDSAQLAAMKATKERYAPELARFSAVLKRIVRTNMYHDGASLFELQCALKGVELSTLFPRRRETIQ